MDQEAPQGVDAADSSASAAGASNPLRAGLEHLAGITGSVGKTTTKEILATLLVERFKTAKSPGNLNNLFGFPLALLGMDESAEWLVAEMGMSTPGELGRLSRLARPDVAVVTSVRPVHLEYFGTLAAIADAKAEILEGMDPSSPVSCFVVNLDDPEVVRIGRRWAGRSLTFGVGRGDVHATAISERGSAGVSLVLHVAGASVPVELSLYGAYNVENFLAAAAIAVHAGLTPAEIAAGAAKVLPSAMRGVVRAVELQGDELASLSNRELQVFRLLGRGLGTRAVADELSLSVKTVSTYRTRVMEKMKLASNSDLTYYALKAGLIQ